MIVRNFGKIFLLICQIFNILQTKSKLRNCRDFRNYEHKFSKIFPSISQILKTLQLKFMNHGVCKTFFVCRYYTWKTHRDYACFSSAIFKHFIEICQMTRYDISYAEQRLISSIKCGHTSEFHWHCGGTLAAL